MAGLEFHKLRGAETCKMSERDREAFVESSGVEGSGQDLRNGHFRALASLDDVAL